MLPERPNTDAGDRNPQVVQNFSVTPGLTPVKDHPLLIRDLKALHEKHHIPYLSNAGLHHAGSPFWTQIDTLERPHTLILVIELKKADRDRWRDIDSEARTLLWEFGLQEECYLRYYITAEEQPGQYRRRRGPEASMRRPRNNPPQTPPERSSSEEFDPDMPALERVPVTSWPQPGATSPTWDPLGDRRAGVGRLPQGPQTNNSRRERLDEISDEFNRDVLDRLSLYPPRARGFGQRVRRAERYLENAVFGTATRLDQDH